MGLSMRFCSLVVFSLIFLSSKQALSQSTVVKTLPGFTGNLPFKLETGYVRVDESEIFYYFAESERSRFDPLILYLNGGPGCSGLNGFFYQIGPLFFNSTYEGGLPTLSLNVNSWTNVASIIFVDAPIGTGFSYSTTTQGYQTSDTISSLQIHHFIRKWLNDHPQFIANQFFIGSDAYSGLITPVISQEILNGNQLGIQPRVNLIGYVAGSPHTDSTIEENSKIPYAFKMALLSNTLYESAKGYCYGKYVDVDPSLSHCLEKLKTISECLEDINQFNILEPKCDLQSPNANDEQTRRSLRENSNDYFCRDEKNLFVQIWANDKNVQEALHVRPGTVSEWFRCNISLPNYYGYDIESAIGYHQNLTKSGLQVLIFSGDHDMITPHISTEQWIKSLNLTIATHWRPWFVDGQVGGYVTKYLNYAYRLTYATVKGAGNSPTEYRRRETYKMFDRWIRTNTL